MMDTPVELASSRRELPFTKRVLFSSRLFYALGLGLLLVVLFGAEEAEGGLLSAPLVPGSRSVGLGRREAFQGRDAAFQSAAPSNLRANRRQSTAVCSLASFFRRRRTAKKTQEADPAEPEGEASSDFDAFRFLGLAGEAATQEALKNRLEVLEAKRRELEAASQAPLLRLAVELIQESAAAVSAALAKGQTRTVASPGLQALIPELPELDVALPEATSKAEERKDEDEDDDEDPLSSAVEAENRPTDLLSALLRRTVFSPLREKGTSLFGAGAVGGRKKAARGEDVETEVEVGFREAALGGRPRSIRLLRKEQCSGCKGSGLEGSNDKNAKCESCKGTGMITKVSLPPGVENGALLRVSKQGHSAEGGGRRRGDLLVRVFVRNDEEFERKKGSADILSNASLSLAEAVHGCEKEVRVVDGFAKVQVPPLTKSGSKFVIAGRGARLLLGSGSETRGDHVVTFKVALPDRLSAEDKELLQRLNSEQQNSSGSLL